MVKRPVSQEQASFLGGCLVDSDSEFEKRARKIKRRALVASIVFQIFVVAALILFPLLSKGESIAAYSVTPSVPYRHGVVGERRERPIRPRGGQSEQCHFCAPRSIPPHIVTVDRDRVITDPGPDEAFIPGTPVGQNIPGSLDAFVPRVPPTPPGEQRAASSAPRTLKVSAGVQAARLVYRVEPVYPFLAKSVHREGRVELRAMIATDGRIKALEVVSGDPLFIQSALSAVRDWRYQATLLNGEPVEIETYITVVYTLSH
ncbi:MAG TPA: energy transducer TonB [Methylomirabilota bacterium]|nr:energy transducer TonB [Methylomirabilota bacterium]